MSCILWQNTVNLNAVRRGLNMKRYGGRASIHVVLPLMLPDQLSGGAEEQLPSQAAGGGPVAGHVGEA